MHSPHTVSSTAPIPINSPLLHLHLQQQPHPSTLRGIEKRHLTRMPHAQATTTHTSNSSDSPARPASLTQQQNYRPPQSAPRAPLAGFFFARVTYSPARANHLRAPHTLARRASRPTDPAERAKRRAPRKADAVERKWLASFRQARDQHPVRLACRVLYCAVVAVCCGLFF